MQHEMCKVIEYMQWRKSTIFASRVQEVGYKVAENRNAQVKVKVAENCTEVLE